MEDLTPPPELSRKLTIRRKHGRLTLTTPMGRHAWLGGFCLLIPVIVWALQLISSRKDFSMSSGIDKPWLAFIVDQVLPNPSSVPFPLLLVAAGFGLIGVLFLFHSLVAVVDRNGISTVHTLFLLPYFRAKIPARDIVSFSMKENGRITRADDDFDIFYCIVANSGKAPRAYFCGFPLQPDMRGKEIWEEWLAFSLPGENAAEYVLALVQAACPLTGLNKESKND